MSPDRFVTDLVNYLPVFAAGVLNLLAIVVVAVLWNRAPKAAIWAMVCFILLLLINLASPFAFHALRSIAPDAGMQEMARNISLMNTVITTLRGLVYVLLAFVVFMARPRQS